VLNNIPNIISFARLAAVPVMVWLVINDEILIAFWVFIAAGVSDAVDGFIAKRFNAVTELGAYVDPLADKALLVSVYIVLGLEGYLETWLVILVVFRDVVIIGGAIVFQIQTSSLTMAPLFVSKVNTLAQIILAALVLAVAGFQLDAEIILVMMMGIVAVTTFLSGLVYVVKWSAMAGAMEDDG